MSSTDDEQLAPIRSWERWTYGIAALVCAVALGYVIVFMPPWSA